MVAMSLLKVFERSSWAEKLPFETIGKTTAESIWKQEQSSRRKEKGNLRFNGDESPWKSWRKLFLARVNITSAVTAN